MRGKQRGKTAGFSWKVWALLALIMLVPLVAIPAALIYSAIRDAPPANGIPVTLRLELADLRSYAELDFKRRGITVQDYRIAIEQNTIVVNAAEVVSTQGQVYDLVLRGRMIAEKGRLIWQLEQASGRGVTLPRELLASMLSEGTMQGCCSAIYVSSVRIDGQTIVIEGLRRP